MELERERNLVRDLEQKIGTELGGSGSGSWITGPVSNTVRKRVDRTSFLGKIGRCFRFERCLLGRRRGCQDALDETEKDLVTELLLESELELSSASSTVSD